MKEKKTDIKNQVFYSKKMMSMTELNEHWAPNNEIVKLLIGGMYEELKHFIDDNYDLNKQYYPDDIIIENRIRFIPSTVFREELKKSNETKSKKNK